MNAVDSNCVDELLKRTDTDITELITFRKLRFKFTHECINMV